MNIILSVFVWLGEKKSSKQRRVLHATQPFFPAKKKVKPDTCNFVFHFDHDRVEAVIPKQYATPFGLGRTKHYRSSNPNGLPGDDARRKRQGRVPSELGGTVELKNGRE